MHRALCATLSHVGVTWWSQPAIPAPQVGPWSTKDIWWQDIMATEDEPSSYVLMEKPKQLLDHRPARMELCCTLWKVIVALCLAHHMCKVMNSPAPCARNEMVMTRNGTLLWSRNLKLSEIHFSDCPNMLSLLYWLSLKTVWKTFSFDSILYASFASNSFVVL
jgi:hypothetical protein